MSNIFSKIAQLFSSNKEGQRPQSTEHRHHLLKQRPPKAQPLALTLQLT